MLSIIAPGASSGMVLFHFAAPHIHMYAWKSGRLNTAICPLMKYRIPHVHFLFFLSRIWKITHSIESLVFVWKEGNLSLFCINECGNYYNKTVPIKFFMEEKRMPATAIQFLFSPLETVITVIPWKQSYYCQALPPTANVPDDSPSH